MKYCNKCGNKLKEGAKFCTNCGNKNINAVANNSVNTSGKCPKCGADISGKKFCTACGYKIPTSQSVINAQVVDIKIDDSIDIETLYKRAFMYLEDDKKNEALTYFEHFLDKNPEDSRAYFGKLMIECRYAFEEDFKKLDKDISNSKNFKRAYKYGDDNLREKLNGYILTYIKNTVGKINTAEEIRSIYTEIVNSHPNIKTEAEKLLTEREAQIIENYYQQAVEFGRNAKGKDELLQASQKFSKFNGYKDSEKLAAEYKQKSKEAKNDAVYNTARRLIDKPDCSVTTLQNAITTFESIKGWKDSQDYIEKCHKRIAEIKEEEEACRAEAARQEKETAEARARAKKLQIRILLGILAFAVLVIACALVYASFIKPGVDYDAAIQLMNDEKYLEASEIFEELGDYKDSEKLAVECIEYNEEIKMLQKKYDSAVSAMNQKGYLSAIAQFEELGDFLDAKDKIAECESAFVQEKYDIALTCMSAKEYENAISYFEDCGDYKDSKDKIVECNEAIEFENNQNKYNVAIKNMNAHNYEKAISNFEELGDYSDSKAKIEECNELIEEMYNEAEKLLKDKKYSEAKALYDKISYYSDSKDKSNQCDEKIKQSEYDEAVKLMNNGEYEKAINTLNPLGYFKDAKELIEKNYYNCGIEYMKKEQYGYAEDCFENCQNYKDSKDKLLECREGLEEIEKKRKFKNAESVYAQVNIDDGHLNVREEPNGKIIDKIYDGNVVWIVEVDGDWAYIRTNDYEYGYVAIEFLE